MAKEKLKGKKLLEKEIELSQYQGNDRIVSSHELAEELKNTDDSIFRIDTGIKSLDRILCGVEAGELIIVTGPTGEGKTTLLMSITQNIALNDVNSVWFTLEVTPRQFLKKLVKASGEKMQVPLFYLPHASIDDADNDVIKKWERDNNRNFEMMDWIEERIIEAKIKVEKGNKKLKVVFIDHIHQIFEEAKSKNVSLEIGGLVARIKSMAITHNLAIFLIAHTKDDPQNSKREMRKQDIRDSGLISRLADTIIGVWRIPNTSDGSEQYLYEIEENDNKAKIRVFKNRREGTQGYFTMHHKNHYLTEDPFFGDKDLQGDGKF